MYTDDHNARIELGRQLGSRGGEGCVFEVTGKPDLAAKIYHDPLDGQALEKLGVQLAFRTSDHELRQIAAWPKAVIKHKGRPVGFLMDKAEGKSVHLLYRPNDRSENFPMATLQGLVSVAQNVAAAFHSLHARSVLMADVNETNLLITQKGEVRLIDCDSYQFTASGATYPCGVRTGMWTPPELQGQAAGALIRHEQHDAFGLAVLIFHILFMGKHPFAGVPPTQHLMENPPSLEDCIRRFQFAHTRRGRVDLKAPPFSLPLASLPDSLADLFEQAFLTEKRPAAATWHRELGNIEFQKCRWGHLFYRRLSDCPWCVIWNTGGPNFFVVLTGGDFSGTSTSEIERLLADIETTVAPVLDDATGLISAIAPVSFAVPALSALIVQSRTPRAFVQPPPPVPLEQFIPTVNVDRQEVIAGWILLVPGVLMLGVLPAFFFIWLGIGGLGLAWLIRGSKSSQEYDRQIEGRKQEIEAETERWRNAPRAEKVLRAQQLAKSKAAVEGQLEAMSQANGAEVDKFEAEKRRFCGEIRQNQKDAVALFTTQKPLLKSQANDALRRYRELAQKRETMRLAKLKTSQMEDFLRSKRIADHPITQIGSARRAKLINYGVFTAWDVQHMGHVPGLHMGSYYLDSWVSELKKNFRINPAGKLSPVAEQELRRDMLALEKTILDDYQSVRGQWINLKLKSDPTTLIKLRAEKIAKFRVALEEMNRAAASAHKQREARLAELLLELGQAKADAAAMPV